MAEEELKIRDFCGDYALDIPIDLKGSIITLFFNSRRNAENVKRIIEVDDSKPNEAPVCDMQEVVRCKDCRWRGTEECSMYYRCNCGEQHTWETDNDFCSCGERKCGDGNG